MKQLVARSLAELKGTEQIKKQSKKKKRKMWRALAVGILNVGNVFFSE